MRRIGGALAALFLAVWSAPAGVAAQEMLVPVRDEAAPRFPDELVFELSAHLPVSVESAEVRYRVESLTCGAPTSTGVAEVTQGERVDARWEWDLRESGGLPIGAALSYRWRIAGEGRVFETAERTFVHEDPRFEWREIVGEHAALRWYTGDEAFAREVLAEADAGIERLIETTGAAPSRRVVVRIYEDAAALREALLFSSELVGGVAYPRHWLVAIGMNRRNFAWGKRAMVHEMTHVVIGEAAFACGAGLPSWLDEGLAMYNEGRLPGVFRRALDSAVDEDRVFRLGGIAGRFPSDEPGAVLAYAQSWSIVDYLLDTHGAARMDRLLRAFAATTSIEQALVDAYGFGRAGLEDRWRASLGLQQLPPPTVPTPVPLPDILPLGAPTPTPTQAEVASPQPTPSRPPPTVSPTAPDAAPAGGAGCNRGGGEASGLDGALLAVLAAGAALSIWRAA